VVAELLDHKQSPLKLGLNPDYKYFCANEIPLSIRGKLTHSKGALSRLDGIIIPTTNVNSGALPLFGKNNTALSKLSKGCELQDIQAELSKDDFNRLCCAGFITAEIKNKRFYGAAIPAAIATRNDMDLSGIRADDLSTGALNHVVRLNLSNHLEMQTALYLYNHFGVFNTQPLNSAVEALTQFVGSGVKDFIETPPPKENPDWHFFRSDKSRKLALRADQDLKIYISPSVPDTKECLRILKETLPQINPHTWKIGRGHHGLARPDKICLYFSDKSSLHRGVTVLKKELSGIKAQGVPFTFRHDPLGLICSGADIPRSQADSHAALSASWRVWITSRLAMAMHLNNRNQTPLLTAPEAALLSIKFMGINPSTWAITNSNFWRH
jgi:hypothetical protein